MGECIVGGLGGGGDWKLVDEWNMSGGYSSSQYSGVLANSTFAGMDKVRIEVQGTSSLSGGPYGSSKGHLLGTLINGASFSVVMDQVAAGATTTQEVKLSTEFFVVTTNNSSVTIVPSSTSENRPSNIDAIKLSRTDDAPALVLARLNIKVYAK